MAPKKIASHFSTQNRIVLPGSEKAPRPPATGEKPCSPSSKITVSVLIRRKRPLKAANCLGRERLTRAQYRQLHAADPAAVKLIRAFAQEFGLTVEPGTPGPELRIIKLTGSAAAMQRAFGVTLVEQTVNGGTYRIHEGSIHLPQELAGAVEAVLGLDNLPQAQPHFRLRGAIPANSAVTPGHAIPHAGAPAVSYTPDQVGQLYQFPQGASAAGQTIGIIELGGGYRTADLTAYFKSLGQTPPTVTAVSVDKGKNSPGNANGADGEVMLDIEVCAAVAPGAKIVVYFAPNTDQGFIDAIANAVHDTTHKPSVISISWGAPESAWSQQSMNALDAACQSAAALGVSVTVASGDNGSTDGGTGNNVDFPASSPHVLACGGTKLIGSGSTITSEVVWNELANSEGATGGGVSSVFARPTWQANANVPAPAGSTGGRGVPDVAGDADPATGYTIRVDGQTMVIGGTSAVAPLWAGLIALNNAQNKRSAGFFNPQIYATKAASAFHDIVSGDNGAFSAGPGWDACTGLGSPIGTQLIKLLAATGGATARKRAPRTAGRNQAARKTTRQR
jgi:kumamolisin